MKIYESPELITEVDEAVNSRLHDMGYRSYPGRRWVKKQIGNVADLDWGNDEVKLLNIEDIIELAVKHLEKEGVTPRPMQVQNVKTLAFGGSGLAYATAEVVRESAGSVRKAIWNDESAPFELSRRGFQKSVAWLRDQEKLEKEKLVGNDGGELEVRLTLQVLRGFTKLARDLPQQKRLLGNVLKVELTTDDTLALFDQVKRAVQRGQVAVTKQTVTNNVHTYPLIELNDQHGSRFAFTAYPKSTLFTLWEMARRLSFLTGWWNVQETIQFILFEQIPLPELETQVRFSLQAQDRSAQSPKKGLLKSIPEITLKVRGPTTVDELADAYRSILVEYGLKPKPLSLVQKNILELVYSTPNASWSERYQLWLERCRDYNSRHASSKKSGKELPDYKQKDNSGKTSLYKEYKRALQKLNWNEQGEKHVKKLLSKVTPNQTLGGVHLLYEKMRAAHPKKKV